jgi:hypothetical protein
VATLLEEAAVPPMIIRLVSFSDEDGTLRDDDGNLVEDDEPGTITLDSRL